MNVAVVVPEDFRHEHVELDPKCWCGPRLEPTDLAGGVIIVHEEHCRVVKRWRATHYGQVGVQLAIA